MRKFQDICQSHLDLSISCNDLVGDTELQLVLAMTRNLSSATVCKIDPKGAKKVSKYAQKPVKKGVILVLLSAQVESQCFPYAGFFVWVPSDISWNSYKTLSCRQLQINLRA